ncbi:ATP-binding protein [Afifella pfennigii]|uniref:ATP-binding protein n=1 Tax=Afifella pfennigii TaxID=209897 RepID=UPI00047E21DF|nr:hypothetical protein [Afifella pfennigii]
MLLLGNYRPTITLVRTLKQLGYLTMVGLGGGEGEAERSRFADEAWDHPPLEEQETFIDALLGLLAERPDIKVVLPVAEGFVRLLADIADRLPDDRLYATPTARHVKLLLDKFGAYALAEEAGIPVAPFAQVDSYEELTSEADRIGFPLVIRSLVSAQRLGQKKALTVDSEDGLTRALPAWPAGHRGLILQRQVRGLRHNVYFAAQKGRLVRHLETLIERTDHPDGTGLAVEGRSVEPDARLLTHTKRLLGLLSYTGIGCAQFLVDRKHGEVHFLEINPRVAGNHAIAEAAGLQLGELAIRLADPATGEIAPRSGQAGLLYAWTYGDIRGLKAALAQGDISAGAAMRWAARLAFLAVTADVHMTWSWRDPMPTLCLFARQLGWKGSGGAASTAMATQRGTAG